MVPVTQIISPFPRPPGAVLFALEQLAILRLGDASEMQVAGDLADLPRPWEPASCPDDLRTAIWEWCDAVAGWLNDEFAWRPAQMVPPCWPRHPHLARELPILAVLRWEAEESTSPDLLEDWHRYALPMFGDRMATRLGESTCHTTGKHQDWPAAGRAAAYHDPGAIADRWSVLHTDTPRANP
jgi:hypothetical protein